MRLECDLAQGRARLLRHCVTGRRGLRIRRCSFVAAKQPFRGEEAKDFFALRASHRRQWNRSRFLGGGDGTIHNEKTLLRRIGHFVKRLALGIVGVHPGAVLLALGSVIVGFLAHGAASLLSAAAKPAPLRPP
jgi:hypothetical protein